MLYICIPSHNEAATIGLLLWKIRQTFQQFPREYELLVLDDGSTDDTGERLEPYGGTLPLTVVRHPARLGYARSVEALLRLALERTDRPKRDAAVLMHADFGHGPQYLPDIVRRIDSGADVVVTQATLNGQSSRGYRLARRWARWLLRGPRVPGVRDVVSGYAAFRLITLRNVIQSAEGPFLSTEGWAANAQLLALAARHARRIETIATVERHDLKSRPSRVEPWPTARDLWRAAPSVRVPRGRHPGTGRGQAEEQELEEVNR